MSSFQVILLNDIPSLGKLGDVVKVKRGYARNHLLPTGQAQSYTKENMAGFAKLKQRIVQEQQEREAVLRQTQNTLDGYLLQVVEHAGEDGALYGSINASKIANLLKDQGYEIKRDAIVLPNNEVIKKIGEYDIIINLALNVVVTIKLAVLSDRGSDK